MTTFIIADAALISKSDICIIYTADCLLVPPVFNPARQWLERRHNYKIELLCIKGDIMIHGLNSRSLALELFPRPIIGYLLPI